MKSYRAITEAIKANAARIEALEAEASRLDYKAEKAEAMQNNTGRAAFEAWKALDDKADANRDAIREALTEAATLKIENLFLVENRRAALVAEALPAIVAAFEKYDGKPYGERTEQKIREAIRAAGFYAYMQRGWSAPAADVIVIDKPDENGHTYGTTNQVEARAPRPQNFITEENRINLEAIRAAVNPYKYTENTREAAEEIRAKFEAVKAAYTAAEEARKAYQATAVPGLEHVKPASIPYSII